MIPYFSIEAINVRNCQTIIWTSIRCSMITILSVGDGNNWSCLIIKLSFMILMTICQFQDTIVKEIVIKCNILNFVGSDFKTDLCLSKFPIDITK